MTRAFPGDYADRAYERFCAKRDREAQSKRGGRANGHPLQSQLQKNDDCGPLAVFQPGSLFFGFSRFPVAKYWAAG